MGKASSRKTTRRLRSRRAGASYEDVVCELFRQFSPGATVNAGVWVEGPDGRREMDVEIVENNANGARRGIVECKDFNPRTTGPVGIGYIDALDSKRRDLALDFAFICSNAGFTADAVRKAKRVEIGLLGATRSGDSRIRFGVVDEIYTRHLRLVEAPKLHFWPVKGEVPIPQDLVDSGPALFEGRLVEPWLVARFLQALTLNPVVKGRFIDNCEFKSPIELQWPQGTARVQKIGLELVIEGAWFSQFVELDSTAGLYDWLRRRMRVAPGPNPVQVNIKGINFFGGKWISQPPDADWKNQALLPHESIQRFVILKNTFAMNNSACLDRHVVHGDLSLEITGLDEAAIQSVPGFKPDPVPPAEVGKSPWIAKSK